MRLRFLLLLLLSIPLIYAGLTCTLTSSNTCSSGTKYLGVENDTGGMNNSHVQNYSLDTYSNSLCCETDLTDTLNRDCADEVMLVISDQDDAHAQNSSIGTYSVDVCIGLDSSDIDCLYESGSCTGDRTCQFSISGMDNAHVGDCNEYSIKVCCETLNGPPSMPTLIAPLNNNYSVEERNPLFNWTTSIDPQGDPITYQIDLNATGSCLVDPANRNVTGTSEYTSLDELCVDSTYDWMVRACDDSNACSAWTSTWNFSIASEISITFTTNSTDFGELQPSSVLETFSNDTLDDDPGPLVITNEGNVDVNIDLKALDALWTNAALNDTAFQYADQDSSSWNNMTASYTDYTSNLAYTDTRELEINLTVPIEEPPGVKSSVLQALAGSAE